MFLFLFPTILIVKTVTDQNIVQFFFDKEGYKFYTYKYIFPTYILIFKIIWLANASIFSIFISI